MKKKTRIIGLLAANVAIICFWLIPGINTAKEQRYVRYYEDTSDRIAMSTKQTVVSPDTTPTSQKRKIYKKEEIAPANDKKVKTAWFSRAMHFEPVVIEKDTAKSDSLYVKASVKPKSDLDQAHSKK